MSNIEFYQTRMGHKFYEADVPRIVKALEIIAEKLDKPQEKPAETAKITWNDVINGLRSNLYDPNGIPKSFPRFDVSGDDEIMCKTKDDAYCVADFLEAMGVSKPIHASKIEEGDSIYKWEVYPE